MPVKKQDAHRALQLLDEYRRRLEGSENKQLREALEKAIVAIRSRLFQALLDIHEFYTYTLEDRTKTVDVKTSEANQLAERWEGHGAPVPAEVQDQARQSLSKDMSDFGKVEVEPTTFDDDDDWIYEDIDIQRTEAGGLGVSIAGGMDNPHVDDGNPGIFITKLIPGTPAETDGRLQLGDQIVSVNGTSLKAVSHMFAVQTLKDSGKFVNLKVRRKQGRVWTPASDTGTLDRRYRVNIEHRSVSPATRVVDIILIKNMKGLGFSIAGGRGNQHVLEDDGIFVTKIIEGGAAEQDGTLEIGDRIIKVNGNTMVDVTHDEAVAVLKATQVKVLLTIEKNAISSTTEPGEEGVEGGKTQRTVVLTRAEGVGLGFNIIGGEGDTGVFISHISSDSIADRSGQLQAGDLIVQVNGDDMHDCTHEEAATALKNSGTTVTLVVEHKSEEYKEFQARLQQVQANESGVSPQPSDGPALVKQLYVRALFDYDSNKDDDRPSQGLSFKHGDILHVLNGSDDEWWQAALVGNHGDDGPSGIIPGRKRIERRTKSNQRSVKFNRNDTLSTDDKKERKLSTNEKRGARASFKLSRKLPFIKKVGATPSTDLDDSKSEEHIATYEPVKLEPRGYARPVIILGPLKEDINDMLVQEFPDKFAGCVPHTTRSPREGEVDARDYHFVSSVENMERDIQAHLFIEAGRYKDNLYGTSIKAVQEVANQGKHCILGVSGYAIRRLQMADLHPIAICIRPASVDVIQNAQSKNSVDICRQILEKGGRIEQEFAEFFTAVVEGDSVEDIYTKVKNVIHEQSGSFIWVPSSENI
ncbi:disks large 1 tumor suppressor protein-like [Halichondria panicea]|uniref:disks large 1 tumor suppressor protein-like n=1 Tax=Halichondria panicea TaxID=6063 RepID=UPI00312BAF4D